MGGFISARKITKSGRKVVGKFPSIKTGRMIKWESQLERDYLYLVEFDPDVISCYEQPFKVEYFNELDRKIHQYTPDFLLTRRNNKIEVLEVKDEKNALSEEYQSLFRRVAPILNHNGYEFKVVTDSFIRVEPLLSNVKLLQKYAKTKISNGHLICLNHLFSERAEMPLGEVMNYLKKNGIARQEIYALLRHGVISIDITRAIDSDTKVGFALGLRSRMEVTA